MKEHTNGNDEVIAETTSTADDAVESGYELMQSNNLCKSNSSGEKGTPDKLAFIDKEKLFSKVTKTNCVMKKRYTKEKYTQSCDGMDIEQSMKYRPDSCDSKLLCRESPSDLADIANETTDIGPNNDKCEDKFKSILNKKSASQKIQRLQRTTTYILVRASGRSSAVLVTEVPADPESNRNSLSSNATNDTNDVRDHKGMSAPNVTYDYSTQTAQPEILVATPFMEESQPIMPEEENILTEEEIAKIVDMDATNAMMGCS